MNKRALIIKPLRNKSKSIMSLSDSADYMRSLFLSCLGDRTMFKEIRYRQSARCFYILQYKTSFKRNITSYSDVPSIKCSEIPKRSISQLYQHN